MNDLPGIDWAEADFRAWLQSMPPTEIVGTSDHWTECPLATWRKLQFGELVGVGPERVVRDGRDFVTPDWVELFVHDIDERHMVEGDADDFANQEDEYAHEPVPAAEALAVLDEIAARAK